MKAWHFGLVLAISVYAYLVLPAWSGFALATSMYVLWQEYRA